MKGVIATLAFVVALGVAVFVVTRSNASPGLSPTELRWVARYAGWWSAELATLEAARDASRQATQLADLQRPFAALVSCGASYRAAAGAAPQALRDVERISMRACGHARQALDELRRDPSVPVPRRTRRVSDAIGDLVSADRELTRHLLIQESLPTADEPGDASRSNTRYSAAATDVLASNIEVRCWSREDWRAIRSEAAALGPETARRFFGVAGTFEGVANLAPNTCTTLDRLAYEHDAPTKGPSGRRLVEALLTLGREAEHGRNVAIPAEAQCSAIQDVRPLALRLGATRAQAAQLALLGWRLYRTRQLRPTPWTAGCRDGGPLDLNASGVWP